MKIDVKRVFGCKNLIILSIKELKDFTIIFAKSFLSLSGISSSIYISPLVIYLFSILDVTSLKRI